MAQACGKNNFNLVTINDLVSSFDTDNIVLTTIIDKTEDNKTMYNILIQATKPILKEGEEDYSNYGNGDLVWNEKDIYVATLNKINFDNVALTSVLEQNSTNKKMFDILKELSIVDSYDQITIGHLKTINIDNLSLTTAIGQNSTNKKMFDK